MKGKILAGVIAGAVLLTAALYILFQAFGREVNQGDASASASNGTEQSETLSSGSPNNIDESEGSYTSTGSMDEGLSNDVISQDEGWKTIEYTTDLYETSDWSDYYETGQSIKLKLRIPSWWYLSYSVIFSGKEKMDDHDLKVGEFGNVIRLKDNRTFPNNNDIEDFELLEANEYTTKKGTRVYFAKYRAFPSTGYDTIVWYPHIYDIIYDGYVVNVAFYSYKETDAERKAVFDQIVESLEAGK